MMNMMRNSLKSPSTAGDSRRHGCAERHIQLLSLQGASEVGRQDERLVKVFLLII